MQANALGAASPAPIQRASLAAEKAAPRIDPVSGSAFIVMSAWESVEVTPSETGPKQAESKTAGGDNSVRAAGPANAAAAQRISPRITVTRMYLKIYSTGDKESTWLVIQL